MAENLTALVWVLVLTTTVLAFARAPACAIAIPRADFARRRDLWIALTLVIFLANNFWIYISVSGVLLFFAARRDPNKFALFFFLLLALPDIDAAIRGVGPIKTLFTINSHRLLSLTVLLPAYLALRKLPDIGRFGHSLADKLILAHIILYFLLTWNAGEGITNSLRQGLFYGFLDSFLPYYVASRSLRTLQDFRSALMGYVVGALVIGLIGVFEFVKGWLLYGGLTQALGADLLAESSRYSVRGGALRAVATSFATIPYGYVMAVATGLYLYVGRVGPSTTARYLGWMLLLGGLIASLSRGPWVGAAAMLLIFIVTSRSAFAAVSKLAVVGIFCLPLLALPINENMLLDYLPFVGTIQSSNITYRVQLFWAALEAITRWPFFGSFAVYDTPEMLAMKQGQGIVDVVNTYLQIVLERGLVGLSVFVGFFATIAVGIVRGMKTLSDRNDERYALGQALLATLLGALVIIATVSSIHIVPWILWSIAGIGMAYSRMMTLAKTAEAGGSGTLHPAAALR